MNNIARIIASVVLLGACAAAMRFTMQSTEIAETRLQKHKMALDVSKAKELKLIAFLGDAETLFLKPDVPKKITATYNVMGFGSLALQDDTQNAVSEAKDLMQVRYSIGNSASNNFIGRKPRQYGVAELFLPREVPISLEVYGEKQETISLDLTGLELKNLRVAPAESPFAPTKFQDVNIKFPNGGLPKSLFLVQNDKGRTNINFSGALQGNLVVHSKTGLVDIWLNELGKNKNVDFFVWGDAESGQALRQRLSTLGSHVTWQEPKQNPPSSGSKINWYITGQSNNPNPNGHLSIQLNLGKSAQAVIR